MAGYLLFDFGEVLMLLPDSALKSYFCVIKETIPVFQRTTTLVWRYKEDGRESKRKYLLT
jgi:hypothetical protein